MNDHQRHMALDPSAWAVSALEFQPDPWQSDVLRSTERNIALNCCRQSGKSTIAAILALHRALFFPPSLIILVSPSERQSYELFKKVRDFYDQLDNPVPLVKDGALSMELANGSRIIALPSSEKTIRGYSGVCLLIEDEAAAVPDEIHNAVFPMLATTNGQYIQLSTPRGKKGHFYEAWISEAWKHVRITAEDLKRLTAEFLARAKAAMGSRMFAQEFMCEFLEDMIGGMFQKGWFKLTTDYPRDGAFVRRWDMAATEAEEGKDPDWTVGVKMCMKDGQYWIVDVVRLQGTPKMTEDTIKLTAQLDGPYVPIRMEREGGSAGKGYCDHYARNVLVGYNFLGVPSTGEKSLRAGPFSAAAENGNVFVVEAPWNADYLDELSAFPTPKVHDDQVDASSGAFEDLRYGCSSLPDEMATFGEMW